MGRFWPLAVAGWLMAGSASAEPYRWHSEPRPPNPSYDRPYYRPYFPRVRAPSWRDQRWPAYFRGERGDYDPSTVATYATPPAPPNACGPSAFEVMNARPGETRCARVQHGW